MSGKSLADLRKIPRTQLKSITKDELIDSILSASDADVGVVARLEERLLSIATELSEIRRSITVSERDIGRRLAEMEEKIGKQADIIMQQQLFMEKMDRKERETNLVVLGVPDEQTVLEGATNDDDKLGKVWDVLEVDTEIRSHRRLGRLDPGNTRSRPILVTVATKEARDRVLEKTSRLKDRRGAFGKIYIKKDVHPAVREEWKRLRAAEIAEKERPENQGCTIRLDVRERKLYRNGVVIDGWNPHSF